MSPTKIAIYILVGVLLHAISKYVPFRKHNTQIELKWDIFGVGMTVACTVLYGYLIGGPLLSWMQSFASIKDWHSFILTLPWWPMVALNFILADFLNYWGHRALHSELLWHGHAWHHAPKRLWWMAGLRGAPLHVIINILPYTLTWLIFPTKAGGLVGMALALFAIGNQHWQHSNIKIPRSRLVELIFVTPRYHFVHHSANIQYTNSNYGFITTIWDRMFGTHTDPDTVPLDEPIGLDYENSNLRLILGLAPEKHTAEELTSTAAGK